MAIAMTTCNDDDHIRGQRQEQHMDSDEKLIPPIITKLHNLSGNYVPVSLVVAMAKAMLVLGLFDQRKNLVRVKNYQLCAGTRAASNGAFNQHTYYSDSL